jgi:hypothetical protein
MVAGARGALAIFYWLADIWMTMIEALPKGRRTCHTLLPTPSSVTEPDFGHKPSIRRHTSQDQIHSHPFAISGDPKIGSANRNHFIFVALGIR